jgi:hypothetical protein
MTMPSWTWVAALGDFGKTRELLVGMQDRHHATLTFYIRQADGFEGSHHACGYSKALTLQDFGRAWRQWYIYKIFLD